MARQGIEWWAVPRRCGCDSAGLRKRKVRKASTGNEELRQEVDLLQ